MPNKNKNKKNKEANDPISFKVCSKVLIMQDKGNKAFLSKQYPEAIELYTKAIEMKSDEPAFYLNRKPCY